MLISEDFLAKTSIPESVVQLALMRIRDLPYAVVLLSMAEQVRVFQFGTALTSVPDVEVDQSVQPLPLASVDLVSCGASYSPTLSD